VGAALLVGSLVSGCGKQPPTRADVVGGQATVNGILEHAVTDGEITRLVGSYPALCVESRPGMQLCEWRLGKNESGWGALAAAVHTDDRINLLCEVPLDGSPREPGSCWVFPRRSDRTLFQMPKSLGRKPAAIAKYRPEAQRTLDSARTLVELSRVVGAAPVECRPLRDERRLCLWKATSQTYGHGTLCMSAGISTTLKVRMQCELPADGSERALETCTVEVGS